MDGGIAQAAFASQRIGRRSRRLLLSESVVSGLTAALDAAIVFVVGVAVYWSYVGWGPGKPEKYLAAILLLATLNGFLFYHARLYEAAAVASWPTRIHKCVTATAVALVLLVVIAFALKVSAEFSRVWFFSTAILSTILLCLGRGLVKKVVERLAAAGLLVRNVAVIGAGDPAQRWLDHFSAQNPTWRTIIGVFDDRTRRVGSGVGRHPVLGDFRELIRCVREGLVQDVVVAMPLGADRRLAEIVGRLRELPVHIYLAAEHKEYPPAPYERQSWDGAPVLEVAAMPLSGWGGVVKSIEDKLVALLLLVLLSPLLAAIALAVKLDSPGPVLFRQRRCGFNNEVIVIYKFRTMFRSSSADFDWLQARRNDPRVTRVGRFLRCTSLDELPQLFNVLLGTMSMVGPRPHVFALNEQFENQVRGYHGRHRVKPGLTGWAQVNDLRGETDTVEKMQARVEHDIHYVENWSLWLDLWIIFKTVFVFWRHKNAY